MLQDFNGNFDKRIKSWIIVFYMLRIFRYHSYYDVLGVARNASQQEIKRAFFEKSKKVSLEAGYNL